MSSSYSLRPRFVPRVYGRNYLIGGSLYTDAITDLNIRRGRPPFSSSPAWSYYGYSSAYAPHYRHNTFRDDMRFYDDLYYKTSSGLMSDRLRHRTETHDTFFGRHHAPRFMPVRPAHSSAYDVVPFYRLAHYAEPLRTLHSRHDAHSRYMEGRRHRFMHELWQSQRDEEGRHRIRSFYNKTGAVPQTPHHRLFSRPPAVYQLFY